jgi:3-dehydroquinate dehydratase/shikimate dehydrogenase
MIIKTERLILRPWREDDLELFARLNADPRVMEYFPGTKSFEESKSEYLRILEHFENHGWGFWAAVVENQWIGFIGLVQVNFEAPFTPAVEIGWRLAYEFWGNGYAPEGAIAALQFGFQELQLREIVSFTAEQNRRSRRIMEKIGMTHQPEQDFDHPKLVEGHHLRRHVLYKINGDEWQKSDAKVRFNLG